MKQNALSNLILIAYLLMMIVSLVSAVDLFTLSHPSFAFGWIMSVAIEISIAALLMVNRKAPGIKSVLYVLGFITLFQICANTYSAYIHIENIAPFAELFALDEWEVIDQKRMLAFATGGVLPAICLALIYIQNEVREQTETNKTDDNKEPDDKVDNIEDVQIPSDEDAEGDDDGGEAEDASSPEDPIDQPIPESESESEEVSAPQQQDESAADTDINTESEEQAETAAEQLPETDEGDNQSEDTVEPEAVAEEPKKRKYTKKSTSKAKTTKKTNKKTKLSKSNNKKSKASKKAQEQASADEASVTDVPESDPDSRSQESVAELAERLNNIRRGRHNPVSNGYSMML